MSASAALLLAVGLLCMPARAWAAPDGPNDGSSGLGLGCKAFHQIAAGENLSQIAANYGVSVDALIGENGIDDANLIVEGQSLCIPALNGSGYGSGYDNGYNNADHSSYGNGYGNDDSNGYDNSYGNGDAEWKSYGVPGHSYDPSLLNQQDRVGPASNGPSANGETNAPYIIPGQSYDPSVLGNTQSYGSWDYGNGGYDNDAESGYYENGVNID